MFWVEGNTGILTHNCLPKDLSNLVHCLGEAGAPSVLTRAVVARNQLDREKTDAG